jgi:hypothetical protein
MRRLSKSDRRNSNDLDLRSQGYPQITQIAQIQKKHAGKKPNRDHTYCVFLF